MSEWAIKERPRRREPLQAEAETLVRETYHRVSNHLQILASFIGLEAREHPQVEVREALLDVRRRILAIARVHAELQRVTYADTVNIARLLGRLGDELRLSFRGETGRLKLLIAADEGDMRGETAVTLALIFNELVTNAIKHASAPKGGVIEVSLAHQDDGLWRLTVSDNGPGLSAGALSTVHSHGLDLIRLLVRKLGGNLAVDSAGVGATITVHFQAVA